MKRQEYEVVEVDHDDVERDFETSPVNTTRLCSFKRSTSSTPDSSRRSSEKSSTATVRKQGRLSLSSHGIKNYPSSPKNRPSLASISRPSSPQASHPSTILPSTHNPFAIAKQPPGNEERSKRKSPRNQTSSLQNQISSSPSSSSSKEMAKSSKQMSKDKDGNEYTNSQTQSKRICPFLDPTESQLVYDVQNSITVDERDLEIGVDQSEYCLRVGPGALVRLEMASTDLLVELERVELVQVSILML